MRYQKPFTRSQRQAAIAACRALAAQLAAIRSTFRPATEEQKQVAHELHQTVQELVDALRVRNAKVDSDQINDLRERADYLSLHYAMLWLEK